MKMTRAMKKEAIRTYVVRVFFLLASSSSLFWLSRGCKGTSETRRLGSCRCCCRCCRCCCVGGGGTAMENTDGGGGGSSSVAGYGGARGAIAESKLAPWRGMEDVRGKERKSERNGDRKEKRLTPVNRCWPLLKCYLDSAKLDQKARECGKTLLLVN